MPALAVVDRIYVRACACTVLAGLLAWVGCAPALPPVTTAGTHFAELYVVQQQGARCAQSQGSWYAGLMACACPAETLFHPIDGCCANPAWLSTPSSDATQQATLRLGNLAMYVQTQARDGAHQKRLNASIDPHTLPLERLTLPTHPGAYVLTDALAQDLDAAYTVWVMGTFSSIGPHRSPWQPSAKRLPTIKKACPQALERHPCRHAAALCDTAAAMQRELRKRGAPSKKRMSPWDHIALETSAAEPQLARLTAQWKSAVTQAHYVIHLQDDGAMQRHIRIQAEGEQLVLFLDATGNVAAGAIASVIENADQPPSPPAYFDAHWRPVVPM